ncbi:Hsp20/alpha crystallin family protein [Dictyocaulus viviparus]|uniref:Hsp20/alpha crystallin family protein n=1 Tax=Dictyocaulus viviparus TaxID=29172 RepID=A0A0D8X876_DICVI|nr:Hsp20/alpha crystallin family protein [Dictyocaulus viviparus]
MRPFFDLFPRLPAPITYKDFDNYGQCVDFRPPIVVPSLWFLLFPAVAKQFVMALWPESRFGHPLRDFVNELETFSRGTDWFGREMQQMYRTTDQIVLNRANQSHEIANDDKKFAVDLDVSHFKPEELKVHIEGRILTVEGKQEENTDHGYMERAFVRKWALPDDCDMDAIHTQLNDVGHLSIEAPKTGKHTNRRTLSINAAPKKK